MAKSTGISRIASGSRPAVQPSANVGAGGISLRSPRGAPPSTHAPIVSISARLKLRSLRNLSECSGSAPHGGISRADTLVLITFAHRRTSSYDSRTIGATSPARWHIVHLLYMMGATSLVNVGTAAAGAPAFAVVNVAAATTTTPTRAPSTRFMNPPLRGGPV